MRRRKVEVIAIIGDICPAEAAAERSVFEGCDVARAARRAFNDVNAGDAENIKSIDDILVLRLGTATGILFVGETGEIRHTRALAADFLHHRGRDLEYQTRAVFHLAAIGVRSDVRAVSLPYNS